MRDTEDARELCQETFLRVHRQLGQFRHDSALRTWIGRVAWSHALRHLDRKRIEIEPGEAGSTIDTPVQSNQDIEQIYSDAEAAAVVRSAVDALPPLQRTLVALYHLEEISIAEISAITGLPAGTIKSRLFRTRLQLREMLEIRLGVST